MRLSASPRAAEGWCGVSALDKAWEQAQATPGQPIDIGRTVICDSCSDDLTDSSASGGFVFGSYGYCPRCAPDMLATIKVCDEERYIRARCPEGVPFADFIRAYRGPNTTISITPLKLHEPVCGVCKQPFTDQNVRTESGWAETQISQTCEDCFDAMFAGEQP